MKKLIVTAGMPRSGSTWLYNAVRLLLKHNSSLDIGAGWIADFNSFMHHDVVILKIHNYEPQIANNAIRILYSFRDIRDVLASFKRKFGGKPSLEQAKMIIENDNKWREKALYIMKYEKMMEEQEMTLRKIAHYLGIEIKNGSCKQINRSIKNMSYTEGKLKNNTYNIENLLHKNHITDGRHGSWRDDLPTELVTKIEIELKEWLYSNGYL
ncbi:MAG: sulfotransferase domain-containing protein [Chitinispirillia bacterium]|jgi:hypothetical protein